MTPLTLMGTHLRGVQRGCLCREAALTVMEVELLCEHIVPDTAV